MTSANFIASNFLSQVSSGRIGIIQSPPNKGRLWLHRQVCALWISFWHHNVIYVTTELSDYDVGEYFNSQHMSDEAKGHLRIMGVVKPQNANLLYELTRQAQATSPRPQVIFIDSLENFVNEERDVAQIAMEMMNFGNLIGAPIIITAQESRDGSINTRLTQYADMIVDVEVFGTNTMLGVKKNRLSGQRFDKVMV